MEQKMPEHRCPFCKKLLMKGVVDSVEIKCPRCKQIICINNLYLPIGADKV